VRYLKSPNRRDGLPVVTRRRRDFRIRRPVRRWSRALPAIPNTCRTALSSHHVMIPSRRKPESPRTTIRTCGQDSRIRATIRITSSGAPPDASAFDDRRWATGTWTPRSTCLPDVILTQLEQFGTDSGHSGNGKLLQLPGFPTSMPGPENTP